MASLTPSFFSLFSIILLSFHAIVGALDGNWYDAHATFYGDMTGGETMRKYIIIYRHTQLYLSKLLI